MESAADRALATVVSGVFGLLVGSFLNVVIYRLPRGESIARPPSHCPRCGTQLGAVENIPVVSWLALRGRCRHCAAPISPRYPIVELVTGVLFVGIALASPTLEPLAPLDALVAVTLAIGIIDLDDQPVPTSLGWVALACSATLVAVSLAVAHPGRLTGAALGAATGVAAWLIFGLAGRQRRLPGSLFGGLPQYAAWGWATGWMGEAGGLTFGVALLVLVLVAWARPKISQRLVAASAAAAIVAIVVGMVATR